MTLVLTLALLTSSALIAMAASGCVREEIGPTNFHTTAYIERSADEQQTNASSTRPAPDDPSSSSEQSHH